MCKVLQTSSRGFSTTEYIEVKVGKGRKANQAQNLMDISVCVPPLAIFLKAF